QCEGVGVALPDSEDGRLRIYALDFPNNDGLIREGFEPPADEKSAAVKVFHTGEPLIPTAAELARNPTAVKEGMKSGCYLPLISRNRVLGTLTLGSVQENAFSRDDVTFLSQVA